MKFRMLSAAVLALVVGLAVVAPAPAFSQGGVLYVATDAGVFVPASDLNQVRVNFGNSYPSTPTGDRHLQTFVLELDGVDDPVKLGPGETYSYVLDPREVGVLVDERTGLRHVKVGYRYTVAVVEGMPTPRPALTIEILNRRSGAVESFHAFPGFSGGVVVAS